MTRWSRFHSAGQDGFRDSKEELADDIRARVRKRYPSATMKTLERMSRDDLSTLMFTLMDRGEGAMNPMLRKMEADVLFLSPSDANLGVAALIEAGFDVEHLVDAIDECGPTVFFRIRITTELGENRFFDWVQRLVEPFGGDTI
jgi:hypothetical protein